MRHIHEELIIAHLILISFENVTQFVFILFLFEMISLLMVDGI